VDSVSPHPKKYKSNTYIKVIPYTHSQYERMCIDFSSKKSNYQVLLIDNNFTDNYLILHVNSFLTYLRCFQYIAYTVEW
jgi:hypothetical protein